MASPVWDEHAPEDVERLADFLARDDPASAAATFDLIETAVGMLSAHPLVGRRVAGELRELVISRGHTGYVALYEYHQPFDRVIVRAIRHQREAGFED
ncbi:MAG TPA: type II toxin-antitoxin system RelE/ParE family toxin [Usitatibacter sp.]|jgi:plasmid stabilization system protein ParE|nr:type II toxin-antitoxin system RelE/ParE family toxin [Usitatibacter sp.]